MDALGAVDVLAFAYRLVAVYLALEVEILVCFLLTQADEQRIPSAFEQSLL